MTQPIDPQQLLQWLQSALQFHRNGRAIEAADLYRRVLQVDANNSDALHLLGVLEGQRGNHDLSLQLIARAIARLPNVGQFHRSYAQTLAGLQRREEALQSFVRAVQLSPRDFSAYAGAGEMLLHLGRANDAVEYLRAASQLEPNDSGMIGNWGSALTSAGRFPEAMEVFQQALTVNPNDGSVWIQVAEAYWQSGRFDDALTAAQRAVSLSPNDTRARLILGNTFQVLAKFSEAADAYRVAARIDPNSADAVSNLALTLLKSGRTDESLAMIEQAHARWPVNTDIRGNFALALLTSGDFDRGWPEYELRWEAPAFRHYGRNPQPMWDGGDIAGKTILLTMEQGVGDAIQFVRYAPLLSARGAKVLVACRDEIAPIIASVSGVSATVPTNTTGEAFDVHAPLASLPFLFNTKLATIPADVPYVRADEPRVTQWWQKLEEHAGFKVGLVWAGNPMHQNDRSRSCPLEAFAPLGNVPGKIFFSLQKGEAARQAPSAPPSLHLVDLSQQLQDFSDTAALLQCLDLLIAVDTSVVHLAGALGRPVWTILPAGADWRWLTKRQDSPWYPTMRLFRQPAPGDWTSVMKSVAAALSNVSRDK